MERKSKIILFFILVIAFLLRVYNFKSYYMFSHDQDLASWIVKDILVNHHLRLIGQETSSQGVFIGALYYYIQIPFYILGSMNPLGAVFMSIILGVFATYSIYFVLSRIFNIKTGLIGGFIYAVSALIVFTDREVAPTMPVVLWSAWYLYSLFLIYKSKYTFGFVLWGFLIGLIWHLNLALIILSPLILLSFMYSERKLNLKAITLGLLMLFITSTPFVVFEIRHNFSQSKSIYLSLTTTKDQKVENASKFAKFDRVMQLVNKNTIGIFSKYNFIKPSIFTFILLLTFIYLVKNKIINKFWTLVFIFWQVLYLTFFSLNALNPSEYYFNGMNIIWISISALGLHQLFENKKTFLLYFLLISFLLTNISFIFRYNTDKKGYVEKLNLVREIKFDSLKHGYPCVSVSYITSPGYDLGYRYLFYLEKMHVNKPISKSPVYSIVFPLSIVDRVDITFGSLGLIYPEYSRYNKIDVDKSCRGDNSNLTEPMFGYTE